jgi:hypothetical protein
MVASIIYVNAVLASSWPGRFEPQQRPKAPCESQWNWNGGITDGGSETALVS